MMSDSGQQAEGASPSGNTAGSPTPREAAPSTSAAQSASTSTQSASTMQSASAAQSPSVASAARGASPAQSASTAHSAASAAQSASAALAAANDFVSLFECPVCFDYALPPILQCHSGHLVCHECRPKLSRCPTCRGPLGKIRNLAMEKVANSVLFPCKYSPFGCGATLPHQRKVEHEESCDYRRYHCPCPGTACKWQGCMSDIMAHLVSHHKCITTLQGEDIVFLATDINLPGAIDWVMMQSCFGYHFMLVLEKQEHYDAHQQFFATVLLVGTARQAEGFVYRLELTDTKRRLTWEAKPKSIQEGVENAIRKNDCLVFDSSVAKLFSENGNLAINVTISMC